MEKLLYFNKLTTQSIILKTSLLEKLNAGFFFKIKTLRLATSYISYLTRALETDDTAGGFKAELGTISRKSTSNPVQVNDCPGQSSPKSVSSVSPLFRFPLILFYWLPQQRQRRFRSINFFLDNPLARGHISSTSPTSDCRSRIKLLFHFEATYNFLNKS